MSIDGSWALDGTGDAAADIRKRIRALLDDLGVARDRGVKVWGGRSPGGHPCAACRRELNSGEIEYEIVIGNMVTILLHRYCFEIWQSEVTRHL
jgi:hypothetical protein